MKTVSFSKTSESTYQTLQCQNPEDCAATQQSPFGIGMILNVYCKAHYKHRLNSNGTY